ncbi:DUF4231 domain-containing protein [Teredinibacter haidensis]|uniref:DUF4231 domain-containing protein n=1 Tax=Teredinibacter haidensis TaxID=2731755 RepID=UPI0009490F99|nr:DUF4231 domain-containing protein [Teredinibacter haidensis]
MSKRTQYKKRPNFHVTAVQIDLDCSGFAYKKWDGDQHCNAGDWLVNNSGDTYTVEKNYFRECYQEISPGQYEKTAAVWAEEAVGDGEISTIEGSTVYAAGDYLVFDRPAGGESYAIKRQNFNRMYEAVEDPEELSRAQHDYITNRLQFHITWYDKKAGNNRIQYHCWQTLTIVTAALVPVVSAIDYDTGPLIAILGGASAVSGGILSLFKMQENWVKFRAACEDLKSHLAQYKICAGIYEHHDNAFNTLAENCESIISAERGQWVQQNSPKAKKDN